MTKLRVVLADDLMEQKIAPLIQAVCDWLDPAVADRSALLGDTARVETRVTAIRNWIDFAWTLEYDQAVAMLSAEGMIDVGIIDIRWGTRDVGETLLQHARTANPNAALFQYTAHFQDIDRKIREDAKKYRADYFYNVQTFVANDLREALREAILAKLKRMEAKDRNDLLKLCAAYERDVDAFLKQEIGSTRIAQLAIGWHGMRGEPEYPADLPIILRAALEPDLSLEISRYFGIGPIKQITHSDPGYFRGTKAQFATEIEQRKADVDYVFTFSETCHFVSANEIALSNVASTRKILNDFHREWQGAWNEGTTTDSYPFHNGNLETARNGLRYGTAPRSKRLCECKPGQEEHKRNGQQFEIYFPLRQMFGCEIDTAVTKSGGDPSKFLWAACGRRSENPVDSNADGKKQPFILGNYQVFALKPCEPWSGTTVHNWASGNLRNLLNSGFGLFGKLFMAISSNGIVEIYDLTNGRGRLAKEEEFLPCHSWSDECVVRDVCLKTVTAESPQLVFRFLTWRQPE